RQRSAFQRRAGPRHSEDRARVAAFVDPDDARPGTVRQRGGGLAAARQPEHEHTPVLQPVFRSARRHSVSYCSLIVESDSMTSSAATIQKRTTIFVSAQPSSSK